MTRINISKNSKKMKKLILILAFLQTFAMMDSKSLVIDSESNAKKIHSLRILEGIEYPEQTNKRLMVLAKEFSNKKLYEDSYNEVIAIIKKHEGYRDTVYFDINGYPTIGYGFMTRYLPIEHKFTITREESDSILIAKVNTNIKYVKERYPKLNDFQVLAIAHLGYGKGFGRIQRHPVHYQIKSGFVRFGTLVYFSKYEVERRNYRNSRLFEFKLFNTKYKE